MSVNNPYNYIFHGGSAELHRILRAMSEEDIQILFSVREFYYSKLNTSQVRVLDLITREVVEDFDVFISSHGALGDHI